MRKFPPLNSVIAFESVARLGSVRDAADELCVSQPAISHHLRNLEEYLQTGLFNRKNRRLSLTDVGKDYLKEVGPSFDRIAYASIRASSLENRETLTISAPPSLLGSWLIPRLSGFLEGNKNLNLVIFEIEGFDRGIIDCAIEYRFRASNDYKSFCLIPDEWVLLMSPTLFEKHRISSLEDLKGVTLIETMRRPFSWQVMLADFSWLKTQRIIRVSYTLHALRAAEVGLGVTVGNLCNAKPYIQERRLCIPFKLNPNVLPPKPNYFFSVLPQKEKLPKVTAFLKWLQKEVTKDTMSRDSLDNTLSVLHER